MLYLDKKELMNLIKHCRKEFPDEACGILAGRNINGESGTYRIAERDYKMTNTDKSAQTFFMDPKEQLRTMKEIRNLGLEMVGIYHSHPETAAYPSAHDVELAYYPDVSYVIISLKDRENPVFKSFRIVEGKITEEGIEIRCIS